MKPGIDETYRTEVSEGVRFVPSEEWIDAFEQQSSVRGFEEKLKRFARMRANMVAHAGKRIDDLYVSELVQDAIEDTFTGLLAWDPARASLEQHLLGAIRSRTRHEYAQALRFQHFSFDADTASPALLANVESSLAAAGSATASAEIADASERAINEVRRIAANDVDVIRLVDAYKAEATKKIDVLHVSGLTSKRYEAARKRLHRVVLQLPTEVRDSLRT